MSVIKRVKKIIEIKNISNAQLGKAADLHRNTIGNMLKAEAEPNVEVIVGLKKIIPDLNLNWMILGEGEIFTGENKILNNRELEMVKGRLAKLEEKYDLIKQTYSEQGATLEAIYKEFKAMDIPQAVTQLLKDGIDK